MREMKAKKKVAFNELALWKDVEMGHFSWYNIEQHKQNMFGEIALA